MSKLLTPQEALQALRAGKKVEYKPMGFDWTLLTPKQISIACLLSDDYQFRVRQERITIGNVTFPKPETKKPELSTKYYIPCLNSNDFYTRYSWEDCEADQRFLRVGILHLTRENAIEHAKALIKLSGGKADD